MSDKESPDDVSLRGILKSQFETAWSLLSYHLEGLSDEECAWRPEPQGLHVHADPSGGWRPDWPDRETYDLGPPSIAWTSWHILYWWTNALRGVHGELPLDPGHVEWPGEVADAVVAIEGFRMRWLAVLDRDRDFAEPLVASWPLPSSSLAGIAAWLNIELAKNAAEIGYARFLHGARSASEPRHWAG